MPYRIIAPALGALTALFIATPAYAQDPAPDLQDLVGARGSSGEMALQERGYTFVKGEKSGSDSYTRYRQERSGQCIIVRTAEGRYQSLVTAPDFDCQNDASATEEPKNEPGAHEKQHFATVCGAIVDGKPYRYKCKVNGAAPGGSGQDGTPLPRSEDHPALAAWQPHRPGIRGHEGHASDFQHRRGRNSVHVRGQDLFLCV